MGANGKNGKVDLGAWRQHRNRADPALLTPFAGKHIAWNADATRVVASGDSYAELYQKLDAMGVEWDEVVHDFVEGETLL